MTARPLSLRAYGAATTLLRPAANALLSRRLRVGKEDAARIDERRGIAATSRPEGPLVWIHGASVGESLSVLPLIGRLSAARPAASFLVTTGTVTSAALMAERLPGRAIHQYAPLDQPGFVRRFLAHWRPDVGLFVESELWPSLIGQAQRRGIPLALVNGRMSPRSYESWRRRPKAARTLLGAFEVVLAQDPDNAERLAALAGRPVVQTGNIKHAGPALPVDASSLHRMSEAVSGRAVWLAASTHPEEEEAILDAHRQTAERVADLLTIIAPRHPARGDEIAAAIGRAGLRVSRRSRGDLPRPDDDVYLADTLGEMGLFYRLCDVAFIGGSLSGTGGHNPLEPARLGCAIVTGPDLFNFRDIYAELRAAGGAGLVRNGRDLSASLIRLLTDAMTRERMADNARDWSEAAARAVLDDVTTAIGPVLAALDERCGP